MEAGVRLALDDPRRARLPLTGPGPYRIAEGKVRTEACEINVVDHCNLRCKSCSHLSPMMPKSFVDPDEVGAGLATLARIYHARVVRLLGGEPLLHRDLLAIVDAVRRAKVCDVVRITTNGVMLPRISDDLMAAVDEVMVSSYPGFELTTAQLTELDRRARAAGTRISVKLADEFRYSYAEQASTDQELTGQVYSTCQIAHIWRCHTLVGDRLQRCGPSHYLPRMLGAAPDPSFDVNGSLEDLVAFLESEEPLPSCGHCLGTVGRRFPQAQVRAAVWRTEQDRPYEELIDRRLLAQAMTTPTTARSW